MKHALFIRPRTAPRPPVMPPRTERERLLRALEMADGRWPEVWRFMADRLVDYDAGRLPKLF